MYAGVIDVRGAGVVRALFAGQSDPTLDLLVGFCEHTTGMPLRAAQG
jgi:hypothetical protein